MGNKKDFMGLSQQEISKIVNSTQAKEILQRLNQNGGLALQKASQAAKAGDFETVRTLLEPMVKDEKTAALIEQLQKKQG